VTAERHAVGAIVLDGNGRILLVQRGHAPSMGLWSIPGGRVEAGESAEQAVVRELLEETGLRGVLGREVGTVTLDAGDGGVYLVRDFIMRVDHGAMPDAADDAADAAWFTFDEVRSLETSPELVDTLIDWGIIPT
jgi:ADP-ribose pyrophosphatase YjhB (NUDIX family)